MSDDILANIRKARSVRASQAKHRSSKRTIATELEDALLFLAWESELLSEGQLSAMLNLDRVSVRRKRETLLDRATVIAAALDEPRQRRLQRGRDARLVTSGRSHDAEGTCASSERNEKDGAA